MPLHIGEAIIFLVAVSANRHPVGECDKLIFHTRDTVFSSDSSVK